MMPQWAGIVRVSHMGARKAGADNVHADRDQVDAITAAVPKGDELHMLPAELNVSGGLPLELRPSLLAAVEGVERGEYAGIVVAYLSRLGRNVREQLRTYDRVHAAGGRIIVAQEGIDARTRGGRLQRNILAAIHEDEREQHVERFDNLRRWATEAGVWQRRLTPTGYVRDPKTRRLVPDDRADDVRAAFSARATGTSVSELARRLRMTPSGVRQLIANRVYRGELRVGDYTNLHAHPALVTEDVWLAAQAPATTRRPRSKRQVALLAGLVRCCGCGHVMSRGPAKVEVYACHRQHSDGPCPAPAAITARLLDEHVTAISLSELGRLRIDEASDRSSLEAARARVASAERELATYVNAISAADVGADAFRAGARQRQAEVDSARRELIRLFGQQPAQVDGDPVALWKELGPEHRNRLLRGLIECVLVERSGGRGRIRPLEDRVRVVRHGAGIAPVARDRVIPVRQIALPDAHDPVTLRM
jgi:DNA invertase Pin-like site-specific DNA recombinase